MRGSLICSRLAIAASLVLGAGLLLDGRDTALGQTFGQAGIELTLDPDSIFVGEPTLATARVIGPQGEPLVDVLVHFSSEQLQLDSGSADVPTDDNGLARARFSAVEPGGAIVEAAATVSVFLGPSAEFPTTIDLSQATPIYVEEPSLSLALSLDPETINVGDYARATASVTDARGNPAEDVPVRFTSDRPRVASPVQSASATTNSEGLATIEYSGRAAGEAPISVRLADGTSASATLIVQVEVAATETNPDIRTGGDGGGGGSFPVPPPAVIGGAGIAGGVAVAAGLYLFRRSLSRRQVAQQGVRLTEVPDPAGIQTVAGGDRPGAVMRIVIDAGTINWTEET